jgi:hypothetical protein
MLQYTVEQQVGKFVDVGVRGIIELDVEITGDEHLGGEKVASLSSRSLN